MSAPTRPPREPRQPRARARRCPLCHGVSEPLAHQCACGYEFGQSVDKAIVLLKDQRTNARIILGISGVVALATVAAVILGLPFSILALVGSILWLVYMLQKLAITNASLRQLEAYALPVARLVSAETPKGEERSSPSAP